MKLFLTAIAVMAISFNAGAQGFLDKIKKFAGDSDTLGKKQGDTYVIQGNGAIVKEDGTREEGSIRFIVQHRLDSLEYFYFTPATEMFPKKYYAGSVEHFEVNGHKFYSPKIKLDDLRIGNRRMFAEMINEDPADRFKMFRFRIMEYIEMNKEYSLKRDYYVLMPDFNAAHNIQDLYFSPFAKAMSGFVEDCPELSKKIADKEDGYKVNMFKGAANNEIFLRVMREYNNCGKQ